MTLEEADKIRIIWGNFLDQCSGKLTMLFLTGGGKIPESLLPYPKDILEEALNIMDRHYFDTKNSRGMELMRETMSLLELYSDDSESLTQAGHNFLDEEKRNMTIKFLRDWQKTWLATQDAPEFE